MCLFETVELFSIPLTISHSIQFKRLLVTTIVQIKSSGQTHLTLAFTHVVWSSQKLNQTGVCSSHLKAGHGLLVLLCMYLLGFAGKDFEGNT